MLLKHEVEIFHVTGAVIKIDGIAIDQMFGRKQEPICANKCSRPIIGDHHAVLL